MGLAVSEHQGKPAAAGGRNNETSATERGRDARASVLSLRRVTREPIAMLTEWFALRPKPRLWKVHLESTTTRIEETIKEKGKVRKRKQ